VQTFRKRRAGLSATAGLSCHNPFTDTPSRIRNEVIVVNHGSACWLKVLLVFVRLGTAEAKIHK